jgi:hypothetical protein
MQTHKGDSERAPRGQRGQVDAPGNAGLPGPRRRGSISPAQLLALQRTAGNAATSRLLQRYVVGVDPLVDLKRPEARGLIYGVSPARATTSQRLYFQDVAEGLAGQRYRTIDSYNDAAGISQAFSPNTSKAAAVGIFRLRAALMEDDPVAKWMTHFPAAPVNPATDPDVALWIEFLEAHWRYVGLYDLGEHSADGIARVAAKHRFTKNLMNQTWANETALTPQKIGRWLHQNRTYDQANAAFETTFTGKDEQLHIAKWMYSAFFRRTSKLGINFTLARGETIHLNIAADPTYDPSNPAFPNMQEEGLLEIQRMDPEQEYGRAITSSEYRHARWLVDQGRTGKGNVNFYSEVKDPPPPVVLAPVAPAPVKKKKWYKPWTWFK